MWSDISRMAIASMLGVVISGLAFWLTLGKDVPTRKEVSVMIQTTAPYVRDRALILELVSRNTEAVEKVTEATIQLRIAVSSLTALLQKEQRERDSGTDR